MNLFVPPVADCPLCPRLAAFRQANREAYPAFFNGAVPPFGNIASEILIVGLAPGLKGANATGRPFTGDYAGDVLYAILKRLALASGDYDKRADDGFQLHHCRITNAVRCVPPQNKPETEEIRTCNAFLTAEINAMPNLKVIFTLGSIAHNAVLRALGMKLSNAKFAHGAVHELSHEGRKLWLVNSYHSSRYNINTGAVTEEMIEETLKHTKELALQS